MNIYKIKSIHTLCLLQVLLMIGCLSLILRNNVFSESMPSEYISIEEMCKPGNGLSRGEIQVVQGNVVIIRTISEKLLHSCWAKRNLSLFNNDIISTQENGRLRFSFIDGSLVTLASMTELEITRNVYDRAAKARSLFFNMRTGKARFLVCKLDDIEFSEAKVKTNTAIVVTIGSDFIIEATDTFTTITALENTLLEVINLAAPEVEPTLLMDYERIVIEEGILWSTKEKVLKEEIETMITEFNIVKLQERRRIPADTIGVYFSKDELIEPESLAQEGEEELVLLEFFERIEEPQISDMNIFEEKRDDDVKGNLPQFPGPPEI